MLGAVDLSSQERLSARDYFATRSAKMQLDIAFVVDTTGSMHDELDYLRAEFMALAQRIARDHPNSEPRFALVAYGDGGELYEVDSTDFTSSISEFSDTLRDQDVTGGGDYPEAPDKGLAEMNQLSWRRRDVAKIVYWIADAPHHDQDKARISRAIRDARQQDIHIYPVAASGADELTEHTMRSAAQYTGGRYIFLTDDSGVGDAHKEPVIPCYFVTRLDDAIVRTIDIELSGGYLEPPASEIIRTGGDPEDGHCALPGGAQARVF